MVKVLISGSRDASPALLELTKVIVMRAWYRGHEILVGDAEGVDEVVAQTAEKFKANYTAHGITKAARNGAQCYSDVRPLLTKVAYMGYRHRDRLMVRSADIVICIWNGHSTGTRRVYDFAVHSGKRAYLYNDKGLIEKFEPEGQHG